MLKTVTLHLTAAGSLESIILSPRRPAVNRKGCYCALLRLLQLRAEATRSIHKVHTPAALSWLPLACEDGAEPHLSRSILALEHANFPKFCLELGAVPR